MLGWYFGGVRGDEANTDLRFLWNKQLNLLGSHLASKSELMEALVFVESGQIRPTLSTILPLKDIRSGQELMERDEVVGKIVYVPD